MKIQIKFNLKKLGVLAILFIISLPGYSQEVLTGASAHNMISGTEMVRLSNYSTIPSYVKFLKNKELDLDGFKIWCKKNFKMAPTMDFVLISSESDQIGQKHYRYQQTFNGIAIEHAIWIVHTRQDKIFSMNGMLLPSLSNAGSSSLSEQAALEKAITHVGAEIYKWELPGEEAHLKRETNEANATYFPKADVVYVSQNGLYTYDSYRLTYKFNIYAHSPVSRAEIYVDASSGEIIYENEVFHNIDVPGTAQTAYSGSQTIIADSFGGGFRLRDAGRGNGINTYDMNEGTNYGNSVDFTDADNFWDNVNAEMDEVATDAHWGAEMTYDYFLDIHGRNSIDANGFALNSYVHYDNLFANAFWDGQRMTYGDGNGGSWSPLTALDIAGHEITHGLTTFTASLVYQAESGALNESFSDIFGTSIENFARPSNWNWLIGEDIGSALRSMSNPNANGDPDTYFGTNWASLTGGDNGGVHTNSGVQNHWYYLLVTGGTGTNDNADNYTVNGLGFGEASAIAFRNLTVYLTPNSNFSDARFYAIQSAVDLHGGCSAQVESTTNAWYAVGVGPEYVATVTADMTAGVTTSCNTPFTVSFTNLSSNGNSFVWDFGDGNTSTLNNPTHTYTSFGDFTVQLSVDGGSCGTDANTWVDYISVDALIPCTVNMPNSGTGTIQTTCAGTLYDSGGPSAPYGANEDAQITIAPIGASSVDIDFVFFDVEAGQNGSCNYDYVEVHDGASITDPLIDTYCNNNVPGTISSTGNAITIVFHSDPGLEEPGFEMTWSCVLPTTPPVAEFVSNTDTTCNGEVIFTDLSTNGPNAWTWDFGDGNTSNDQNPTHDYTTNGTYTVVLTASNGNGPDVMTKVDYIVVELPAAPSVTDDNICEDNSASLSASGGGGNLNWFDSPTGGTLLFTGPNYNTPVLTTTTSYYVEEDIPSLVQNIGPPDNTFGGGGFFNGNQHLVFDCTSPVTLNTVKVYANGAGNRTVELRNSTGTVLQSAVVNIPDGEQVISLGFDIPVGSDLQLGTLVNSNQDLYRNNDGPSFPYIVGGGEVTITTSSPGTDYYYFFYDWEIQSPGCTSERTQVTATVNPNSDATITPVSALCLSDASVNLTAAETGGTWSGTGVSGTTFDPASAGVGTHTVTYTIPGTCGDTNNIDIAVSNSYDATINATSVLCSDDSPVLIGSVESGGDWSGTGITNTISGEFDPNVAGAGTHTVTYTFGGSCGDVDTQDIIVEDRPDASIDGAGPFCKYEPIHVMTSTESGGAWSADCGSCINANTGEFDPNIAGAGVWTITYGFNGNCPSSSSTAVAVSDCLGIGESTGDKIIIYPNPSNGIVHFSTPTLNSGLIQITDISGKIVVENNFSSSDFTLDLSNQTSSGTYFINLFSDEGEMLSVQKLIIQQ
jgi:Zn-dependent metalloprotease